MKVYDFDGTIYNGDSTVDFYMFCIKKKPALLFYCVDQFFAAGMYLINVWSKKKFKEHFFSFLKDVNTEEYVEEFWNESKGKIKPWFIDKISDDTVIISASPSFLIEPIAKSLGIRNVIATNVDRRNGKIIGENCHGNEKVSRFKQIYPENTIEEFYSDSKSDGPMAALAEKAYIVNGDGIFDWNENLFRESVVNKILELIRYVFWGVATTVFNLILFQVFLNVNIDYIVANIISYFIAVVVSYLFNKLFVFERKLNNGSNEFLDILKYILIRVGAVSIDSVLLWFCVQILVVPIMLAKIIISLIVIVLTYVFNKNFVFKNNIKVCRNKSD